MGKPGLICSYSLKFLCNLHLDCHTSVLPEWHTLLDCTEPAPADEELCYPESLGTNSAATFERMALDAQRPPEEDQTTDRPYFHFLG